jgi:bifunctional UDP-N-acetylglucosamine pyrophosphorylase / glucosamine-1-phosphate N-acetyltransferase
MSNFAAIILAAGKSTRMKSRKSKLLHTVAGVPVISRVAQTIANSGISKTVVVVSHQKEEILSVVRGIIPQAIGVDQGKPLGTGDAVLKALVKLKNFSGDILIVAGDVPLLGTETIEKFKTLHKNSNSPLTILTMKPEKTFGYGRIIRNDHGVEKIIEQKDLNQDQLDISECNGGIYLVDSDWLNESILKIDNNNSQGEFYLTDLPLFLSSEKSTLSLLVDEEELLGVNTRHHFVLAESIALKRITSFHISNGVSIPFPLEVEIHGDVIVGQDSFIGRNVSLRGNTVIGENCYLDQGAVLTDVLVGSDVLIKPYSVLEKSKVDSHAQIGPFAHLRPNTEVGEKAKVGNFVETKNTKLHSGVKASHLSYLGDAEIGEGSNIGAGTITCNYDGVNKFKTTIEENVFIGSDTQLIAPVTVGKNSYVGTGTTVMKDVKPDSLVINPKTQKTISPWSPPVKKG